MLSSPVNFFKKKKNNQITIASNMQRCDFVDIIIRNCRDSSVKKVRFWGLTESRVRLSEMPSRQRRHLISKREGRTWLEKLKIDNEA